MRTRRTAQLDLDLRERTHGGARRGAGRKKKPGPSNVAHRARAPHVARFPVLVTLRAMAGLPGFRQQTILRLFKEMLADHQRRHAGSFKVPHFSIQENHLHLIVEADADALSRGVRALAISFARRLNRLVERTGRVWGDRYHRRDLTSRRQTKNALVYVLNNHHKHFVSKAEIDKYSSAFLFAGWSRPPTSSFTYAKPWPDMTPRTWLLAEGWKCHGPIDPMAVPG